MCLFILVIGTSCSNESSSKGGETLEEVTLRRAHQFGDVPVEKLQHNPEQYKASYKAGNWEYRKTSENKNSSIRLLRVDSKHNVTRIYDSTDKEKIIYQCKTIQKQPKNKLISGILIGLSALIPLLSILIPKFRINYHLVNLDSNTVSLSLYKIVGILYLFYMLGVDVYVSIQFHNLLTQNNIQFHDFLVSWVADIPYILIFLGLAGQNLIAIRFCQTMFTSSKKTFFVYKDNLVQIRYVTTDYYLVAKDTFDKEENKDKMKNCSKSPKDKIRKSKRKVAIDHLIPIPKDSVLDKEVVFATNFDKAQELLNRLANRDKLNGQKAETSDARPTNSAELQNNKL